MINGTIDLALIPLGLILGAAVNWAIYSFAVIQPRAISPWSRLGQREQSTLALVPAIGWLWQRHYAAEFGRGFWVRPMLIEVALGAALPLLFAFFRSGGLTTCALAALPPPNEAQVWTWFGVYTLLLAALAVATFIDFDEKTIPDEITLPGALLALLVAWCLPVSRLPEVQLLNPGVRIEGLNFASPHPMPTWHTGVGGVILAVFVIVVWMAALIPKRVVWRRGVVRGLKLMWLSVWPPPRRRAGKFSLPPRRVHPLTWLALGLAVALSGLSTLAWLTGGERWDSYFSQLVGLGFGGGLVWSVRMIAGSVLDREAMGFGDVTLMAMIGAVFGWQPALLIFCFAPFAAMVIAVFQLMTTGHPEIAFGPYLSVAAVFTLLNWGWLWNDWARPNIFFLGPAVLVIVLVCLMLMAAMLLGWRRIKMRLAGHR